MVQELTAGEHQTRQVEQKRCFWKDMSKTRHTDDLEDQNSVICAITQSGLQSQMPSLCQGRHRKLGWNDLKRSGWTGISRSKHQLWSEMVKN